MYDRNSGNDNRKTAFLDLLAPEKWVSPNHLTYAILQCNFQVCSCREGAAGFARVARIACHSRVRRMPGAQKHTSCSVIPDLIRDPASLLKSAHRDRRRPRTARPRIKSGATRRESPLTLHLRTLPNLINCGHETARSHLQLRSTPSSG
jgi:hypothetical protein